MVLYFFLLMAEYGMDFFSAVTAYLPSEIELESAKGQAAWDDKHDKSEWPFSCIGSKWLGNSHSTAHDSDDGGGKAGPSTARRSIFLSDSSDDE